MKDSGGDAYMADNYDIMYWMIQYRNLEGYELLPASCVAVTALAKAIKEGTVGKDEYVMLNCTGGGTLSAMSKGFVVKEPDSVFSPEAGAEEIIKKVQALFNR